MRGLGVDSGGRATGCPVQDPKPDAFWIQRHPLCVQSFSERWGEHRVALLGVDGFFFFFFFLPCGGRVGFGWGGFRFFFLVCFFAFGLRPDEDDRRSTRRPLPLVMVVVVFLMGIFAAIERGVIKKIITGDDGGGGVGPCGDGDDPDRHHPCGAPCGRGVNWGNHHRHRCH